MLVLAPGGIGMSSEMSEVRGDCVEVDIDGDTGGFGKVVAKSLVSIKASASKLTSGMREGVPTVKVFGHFGSWSDGRMLG